MRSFLIIALGLVPGCVPDVNVACPPSGDTIINVELAPTETEDTGSDDTVTTEDTDVVDTGTEQNCDTIERRLRDLDGDGYGDPNNYVTISPCDSWTAGFVNWIQDRDDCDDFNGAVHPDAFENPMNGIDDNCNGVVDCDGYGELDITDTYGDLLSGTVDGVIMLPVTLNASCGLTRPVRIEVAMTLPDSSAQNPADFLYGGEYYADEAGMVMRDYEESGTPSYMANAQLAHNWPTDKVVSWVFMDHSMEGTPAEFGGLPERVFQPGDSLDMRFDFSTLATLFASGEDVTFTVSIDYLVVDQGIVTGSYTTFRYTRYQ